MWQNSYWKQVTFEKYRGLSYKFFGLPDYNIKLLYTFEESSTKICINSFFSYERYELAGGDNILIFMSPTKHRITQSSTLQLKYLSSFGINSLFFA